MNDKEKHEKELLEKLKEAGKPDNNFSLTLKFNDVVLEMRKFSADKFSLKTVSETRTHFLMNDLIRKVIETFSESDKQMQEELKKEQMDQMWKDRDQTKK